MGGADVIDGNLVLTPSALAMVLAHSLPPQVMALDMLLALDDAECLAEEGTMTGLDAEVITGFDTGDTLTTTALGTAASFAAALKAGTVADNQAYFVRGTYNATLETFTLSSTGNDVLLSTAADAAGGGGDTAFVVGAGEYTVFDNSATATTFFG